MFVETSTACLNMFGILAFILIGDDYVLCKTGEFHSFFLNSDRDLKLVPIDGNLFLDTLSLIKIP